MSSFRYPNPQVKVVITRSIPHEPINSKVGSLYIKTPKSLYRFTSRTAAHLSDADAKGFANHSK